MDRHIREHQKNIYVSSIINKDCKEVNEDVLTYKTSKSLFRKTKVDELVDDFYSNILDWYSNNIYYASIGTLKRYNFNTTESESMTTLPSICINALRVNPGHTDICLGNSNGSIVFYNIETEKQQSFSQHRSRIGIVEWMGNNVLCSGARDRSIKIMDLRAKGEYLSITKHTQEICGLKVNCEGLLLASGGNDNKLMIHDMRFLSNPLKVFNEHKAAVKAIAWSPKNRNLLVSGGGTADKSIKMWDLSNINTVKRNNKGYNDGNTTPSLFENNEELSRIDSYGFDLEIDEFNMLNEGNHQNKMEAIRKQNLMIMCQSGMNQIIGNYCDYYEHTNKDDHLLEKNMIKSIYGGSQICNLYWTNNDEIISTTGYSNHDIRIYNENLVLKEKMYGHRSRVIHFAISNEENCFVTASTNSEFYFWKLDKFVKTQTNRL